MISSQPVAQVRWQEKRLVTGEGRKLWPWLILRDCSAWPAHHWHIAIHQPDRSRPRRSSPTAASGPCERLEGVDCLATRGQAARRLAGRPAPPRYWTEQADW